MAVTAVTPTQLAYNTASADLIISGGTAIDAANTMTIAYPQEGKLAILIQNTFGGDKVVTVEAGDFLAAGQGDLAITCPQNDVIYLAPSSDRFKNADGNVVLSFAAGTTGFVRAIYLP